MSIYIEYETDQKLNLPVEEIVTKVIEKAVEVYNCPYETQVNVLFVDNESIHKINMEYRNIDRPTDVLSFPMVQYEECGDFSIVEDQPDVFDPESGELLLGDIVLSVDKIMEQAKEYGHSEKRELAFLVAHSMLHLFGFDHMEEEERLDMEKRQEELLQSIGYTRE